MKFVKNVLDKPKPGPDPQPTDFGCPNAAAPACGSFSDPARHKSNFGQLRLTTNPAFPDQIQMQAAGFLEGYLTAERIFDYAYNMRAWLNTQTNDSFAVGDWLFAQDKWTREQVAAHAAEAEAEAAAMKRAEMGGSAAGGGAAGGGGAADDAATATATAGAAAGAASGAGAGAGVRYASSEGTGVPAVGATANYWRTIGLLTAQADGLLAGYSARLADMQQQRQQRQQQQQQQQQQQAGPGTGSAAPPCDRLTKWDFLMINALGDMDDLIAIIFPDNRDGGDMDDYDDSAAVATGAGAGTTSSDAATAGSSVGARSVSSSSSVSVSSSSSSSVKPRPVRTPNPERDASFFFRPETPEEQRQRLRTEAAEAAEAAAGAKPPVPRAKRASWEGLTPGQVRSRIAKSGRCSALIKVTPDLSDLLLGHVTWWSYASMLRIYKHYALGLTSVRRHPGAAADGAGGAPVDGRISFSSYPGQISSGDDWYLLGSGLVVTETSLDLYDHTRYNASYGTGPASLLSWQRAQAANLLAQDGASWAELAAQHNSGSYNNQYMIVDLNRFSPGQELQPGLLTITEIIPGLVVTADATSDLERGHWPSYNVPYFPEVYEATGYRRHAAALAARGADYAAAAAGLSYQLNPRAKIFRRDAAGANDLPSLRGLLRSNAFGSRPADPLAADSPWAALCGRGDLDPEDPDVYGCYDGKVTNYRRALALSADAINGPTTAGGQRPFAWSDHPRFERVPHRGMPEVFDASWEEQAP